MTYKKRILITGALGHIGSKMIHGLKPGEYSEIILLDNLSSQRYCSLFNLPENVNYKFIQDDICTSNLDEMFQDVDVVIHLAAITDAASSFENADLVNKVNYEGTIRVAEACNNNRCKLIFPSTTSVYGSQKEIVDETCTKEALKPQSPYAESKLKSEEYLIQEFNSDKSNLKFIVLRLGTIFGHSIGMRFHTAVNKFCWQAANNIPITVWNDALYQKRPYLDIEDAVRAFRFIIDNSIFSNQIYNVLTSNAAVNDIISTIRYYIPNINIEFVDSKIMNQLSYNVLNDKFMNLGFTFKGDLARGIQETLHLLKGINKDIRNES